MAQPTLDKALVLVRNFLERLRRLQRESGTGEGAEDPEADVVAFVQDGQGVRLVGADAKAYRECVDALFEQQGGAREARPRSRRSIESLLRAVVFEALKTRASSQPGTFRRRVSRHLSTLRKALHEPPKTWTVHIGVRNFTAAALPFRFGGVRFSAGTEVVLRAITGAILYLPPRGTPRSQRAAGIANRDQGRAVVRSWFFDHPIATVVLRAADENAAVAIALERVRRALDAINFFAPLFQEYALTHRAYLAGEGARTAMPWFGAEASSRNAHWGRHRLPDFPIPMIPVGSQRARQIGLARASRLLSDVAPSDLTRRIVTALSWAGRAHVEPRPDSQFVMYAIALESLLTSARSHVGVTERVRLRTAMLIGRRPDTRRSIYGLTRRLYQLRSEIVHGGSASDLTDEDTAVARAVAFRAITTVLTRSTFTRMRSARELEEWLDDQLFG